jgi:CheY-like chemotaxis protein
MMPEHLDLTALKVLVVDDSPNMGKLIAEVLRCLGVNKVFKAESAAAGRMVLKACEIDLIFADIEMAGENGLEFVRQIRASPTPRIADVVIVMVSAHATEGRVMEAGAVGANSFLVKPFSVSALARRLAEGIANRRMMVQAAQRRMSAQGAATAIEL